MSYNFKTKNKMKATNLITEENYEAVNNAVCIVKQDLALKNAINSLNELFHVNRINIESFNNNYGISDELLSDVIQLKSKLEKAIYGRL